MLNADPVAVDDQAIVAEPTHGSDQDPMLRTQDPRREGRLVIAVVHRDRRLRDDRSVVDILRDETAAWWVRTKNAWLPWRRSRLRRLRERHDVYVNVACGPQVLPDYVKDMQAISHDYVLMGVNLRVDEDYAGVGG